MRFVLIAVISIFLVYNNTAAQPGIHYKKEESSRVAKEEKAMRRQESRMKADYRRDERRSRKELKKMYKQSNKDAKHRRYDTNEQGNVFGL